MYVHGYICNFFYVHRALNVTSYCVDTVSDVCTVCCVKCVTYVLYSVVGKVIKESEE